MMATTSEVLNRAADLIEERGWATGNCGMRAEPDMPLCLEGAIAAALGLEPEEVRGRPFTPGDPPVGAFVYPYSPGLHGSPAYAAVKSHLQDWDDDLWAWNDNEADGPQVVEVLRACAVIEAAREREAVSA